MLGKRISRQQEEAEQRRERLRGKALTPWAVWVLGPMAYVLACVAGVFLILEYAHGLWLAIGLTVASFFVGHIPELVIVFRYSRYREEWERANSPSGRDDPSARGS